MIINYLINNKLSIENVELEVSDLEKICVAKNKNKSVKCKDQSNDRYEIKKKDNSYYINCKEGYSMCPNENINNISYEYVNENKKNYFVACNNYNRLIYNDYKLIDKNKLCREKKYPDYNELCNEDKEFLKMIFNVTDYEMSELYCLLIENFVNWNELSKEVQNRFVNNGNKKISKSDLKNKFDKLMNKIQIYINGEKFECNYEFKSKSGDIIKQKYKKLNYNSLGHIFCKSDNDCKNKGKNKNV